MSDFHVNEKMLLMKVYFLYEQYRHQEKSDDIDPFLRDFLGEDYARFGPSFTILLRSAIRAFDNMQAH